MLILAIVVLLMCGGACVASGEFGFFGPFLLVAALLGWSHFGWWPV